MAGQGPHQRAVPPFGPQPHVDLEQRSLARDRPAGPDHAHGEAGRRAQRRSLLTAGHGWMIVVAAGFGHEEHVDVTDVVQFPAAALAHTDDREAHRRSRRRYRRPRDRERGVQSGRRQVGQLHRGVVEGHRAGQIACRQDHEGTAVGDA